MGNNKSLSMKAVLSLLLASVVLAGVDAQQTDRPTCPNIECPDNKPEGGMFAKDDCSDEFCSCSYGVPYLLKCEDPWSSTRRRRCATGATTCVTSARSVTSARKTNSKDSIIRSRNKIELV